MQRTPYNGHRGRLTPTPTPVDVTEVRVATFCTPRQLQELPTILWRHSAPRSAPSSPDAFIFVDGNFPGTAQPRPYRTSPATDIDGYVISPYEKLFSRHGYGIAMGLPIGLSRAARLKHWQNGPLATGKWYPRHGRPMPTFSDVVRILTAGDASLSDARIPRARIEAAAAAIPRAMNISLPNALMILGTGNLPVLLISAGVTILGGTDNPDREGWLSVHASTTLPLLDFVLKLKRPKIRTHVRQADHYFWATFLTPLGGCGGYACLCANLQIPMDEVRALLTAMKAHRLHKPPGRGLHFAK